MREADAAAAGESGAEEGRESDAPEALAALAERARENVERRPPDDPDPAGALAAARDGLGPVVARYVEARVGGLERLSPDAMAALDRACADWLVVYARHYGVECDPDVSVRTAAEALLDTHDAVATARVLTAVPDESADSTSDGDDRSAERDRSG